jgi:hypothetical protein
MSRHPYFVLSDFVSWACKFRMHETRIVEPGLKFPLHGPVYEIEQGLAGASYQLWQLRDEYNASIAELGRNPFPLPLRRAVEPIIVLIENHLTSWEWDLSFLRACQFDRIRECCAAKQETRYDALLDAAASWRLFGKDLGQHHRADELALRAEQKEIKPSMTPEEGERLYPRRDKEWYFAPSMGWKIPSLTYKEHAQLCDAIDELEKYFHRATLPSPMPTSPTCLADWCRAVESWTTTLVEMLNRGYRWTDHQWDLFGIYSTKLLESLKGLRSDLEFKPVAELSDAQTLRHRPHQEQASISNHCLQILRDVSSGNLVEQSATQADENPFDLSHVESEFVSESPGKPSEVAPQPRISKKKIALYRKIARSNEEITHGKLGKRREIAAKFTDEIRRIDPKVDLYVFVKRAIAYCYKHPKSSRKR